jgi:phosphoglycolate phosphatase
VSFPLADAYLFDLDGTLVDSLPGIEFSVRAAFGACGFPLLHSNLRPLIGPPIRAILAAAGEIASPADLDALERAFRHSYDSEGWLMQACFPAAADLLRALERRGCRLFIVTNKPRHAARAILDREGLTPLFEAIVTRDSRSPAYRDKAEMLQETLHSHKLVSDTSLMVGDTMEDAIAADSAGIRMVWMTHGYGVLPESPPPAMICALQSFPQWLLLVAEDSARD